MEVPIDTFDAPLDVSPKPEDPVNWRSLCDSIRDEETPAMVSIMEFVLFLHDYRVAGAPTRQTVLGIRRYLQVTQGLLAPNVAEDMQLLQRVLPSIRGEGERYRRLFGRLFDELSGLCDGYGWRRSAWRCEQIRVRGEERADAYIFFPVH